MRVLLACCLALLTGCWTGGPFYQARDAVTAIPAGDYDATFTETPDSAGENHIARVTIRPDGLTSIEAQMPGTSESSAMVMGFAPLDGSRDRYVAWIVRAHRFDRGGERNAYALLVRASDGAFSLRIPACVPGPMLAIAEAAGAIPTRNQEDDLLDCRFQDHASLLAALRRFDANPPRVVETLTFRSRG
jgi:hypothetical protein